MKKALLVGVDTYQDPQIRNLAYSVADAFSLESVFEDLGYITRVLANPTRLQLITAIRECNANLGAGDSFFFYFAGHGWTTAGGAHLLFCSDDVYDPNGNFNAGLSFSGLKAETIGNGYDRAFVLDACRNHFREGARDVADNTTRDLRPINELIGDGALRNNAGSLAVIRSCSQNEHAVEIAAEQHGLFTLAMRSVLRNAIRNGQELFWGTEFCGDIQNKMRDIAVRHNIITAQTPEFAMAGEPQVLVHGNPRSNEPNTPIYYSCPICGKNNLVTETFNCKKCSTEYLCLSHKSQELGICEKCYSTTVSQPSPAPRDINKVKCADIPEQILKKGSACPECHLFDEALDCALVKGKDYVVQYEDADSPGFAAVVITGIGEYCGEKRVQFEIKKEETPKPTPTPLKKIPCNQFEDYEGVYDGKIHGLGLIENACVSEIDAQLTWFNNKTKSWEKKFPGFVDVCDRTFKVKITAPGYAEHTELRRIRILPKPLSLDMVENASFSEYEDGDGGLITSRLKMKDVEPCVIQDKDWAIVEIGMQTDSIVVRGLGNYCGTIRVQIGGTPITHQGKPVAPKGKDTETPSDEPLKIFPAPQFRDYAGVYDGKPHGLELSDCACVDAPGFRCTWFNNSSRSWESGLPQFVDVCDKNINIRIEAAGYRARNEVRRIKIIRKDLNVSMVKEAVVERSETGELVPKIVLEDNEPCVVRDVDREIFDYGEGYVDIDGKGNYCGTIRVQIGGTPIAHQGKPVAPMRPNQNKWLKWLGLSGVILFLIGVGLVADRQYDEEQMRFASEERRKAEVKHVRTAEAVHKDAAQKGNESTNAAQSGTGGKARMPMQKRKTTDEFVRAARNAFVAKDWKTGFDIATNISMNAMSDSYVTYYVGYCYSPTYGTDYPKKKDYEKAYEWFKHTAELEQKSGGGIVQCILGDMEMNGQGCAANIDNAVAWYRISAERKYGRGCYELGKCYEDNIVADTNDNLVAATNWYFKAMSLEYESAKEAHERVLKKKSRIEKLCSRQR